MPATTITDVDVGKLRETFRKTVRAGDADILNHDGINAHPRERLASFFGDGEVSGASGDDGDFGLSLIG